MMASLPTRRFPWFLCSLLFAATALSFLDRQVLSMLAPRVMADFHLDNTVYAHIIFAFQLSYTVMFSLGGYAVDRLGTRLGLALSLAIWSLASAAHAIVQGPIGLEISRFFLGFGEGACFPAVTKGAAEFAPPSRRAFAIGFANGGSALGAVAAPPLTAFLALHFGWRGAFLATGLLGALLLVTWLSATSNTSKVSQIASREAISWSKLLGDSRLRLMLLARFIFDPVFYFYMFWIPQYLSRERHLSLQQIGSYVWIPFLLLGFSQIFSGGLADILVSRGMTPIASRRRLLIVAALITPVSWLASLAPDIGWAIVCMSVLLVAHGAWITNYLALLRDLFPGNSIATIIGLTGTAGGIGGMLSTLAIGPVVDRFSFVPVFAVSGVLYPLALLCILRASRSDSLISDGTSNTFAASSALNA
jgi:ACS family hexuronate transporter-like MFS transporter